MPTDLTRAAARRPRSWWARTVAVAAAATLLAACSQASDTAGTESMADVGTRLAADTGDGSVTSTGMATSAGASTAAMITTASVGVVVSDPIEAALAVSELVEASGGRVTEREEVAPSPERDQQPWAHLTVRVPADQLTSTLASLSTLGTVQNTTVSSTDVSMEVTDLAARIEALQVSADRLETFMAQAATTEELLEAEATLTERQSDLEALQGQQARLDDQIALTTLTIALTTSPTVPAAAPAGFWGGLQNGWDALAATLNVVVVVLGTALPWLVLAAVGFLVYRSVRRRTRPAPSVSPAPTV